MTEATQVDSAQVAEGFRETFTGKLPEENVSAGYKQLSASDGMTGYSANGSLASALVWMKGQCQCNGYTFNGTSWGIAFPGGGALFGTVYTSDINNLFSNTKTWAFTATPAYTAFYFFDSSHTIIGSFQAGSVSTVSGSGGGDGSWSN